MIIIRSWRNCLYFSLHEVRYPIGIFCKKLLRNSHHYKWIRYVFKYRIYCKFAFVVIVLAFKQNRLKLKGSSNYVAPVNSRPAGRGRVKPSNLTFFSCQTPYIFVGCNSLHPEELAPNAQNNECSYWCLQIWLRILHNWHFLESFVQTPKNCSSKTFIKYIFAQCKQLYTTCRNKTSPWWKFSIQCKTST